MNCFNLKSSPEHIEGLHVCMVLVGSSENDCLIQSDRPNIAQIRMILQRPVDSISQIFLSQKKELSDLVLESVPERLRNGKRFLVGDEPQH